MDQDNFQDTEECPRVVYGPLYCPLTATTMFRRPFILNTSSDASQLRNFVIPTSPAAITHSVNLESQGTCAGNTVGFGTQSLEETSPLAGELT
jgi:hypothetical protein